MKKDTEQALDKILEQMRQLVAAQTKAASYTRWGILFNPCAFWVGAHYSPHNKRWCINLLPCVTLWIVKPFGNVPLRGKL